MFLRSLYTGKFMALLTAVAIAALVPVSCNRTGGRLFTSMPPEKTGIKFRNWITEDDVFNVLDYGYLYNGAGVAIGDINNDGLPDIFFSGNFAHARLYLNKGNFRFVDITDKSGVTGGNKWNTGATMADINGDGFLDIYVCCSTDGRYDRRKNLLYLNNGDLTFTECAARYGINDASYSTHSAFFDYDKDGDLDLLVMNHSLDKYAMTNPARKKERDPIYEHRLYKNTGDKFVDVSAEAGMTGNIINFGLGLAVADFNNDGWPDIYICNDYSEQDYFYINNKDGTFSEKLEEYFDHISFSSMGSDAADFNNDGFIDLFTLDMEPEDNYGNKLVAGPDNYDKFQNLKKSGFYNQSTRNMLQLNMHGDYFTETGQYAGVYATNWSWSPLFCDFDNDGQKDLYITNGYGRNSTYMDAVVLAVSQMVRQQRGQSHRSKMNVIDQIPPTVLNNYIYRNNGDYTFTDVTETWGDEKASLSSGAAYADLDNDGDMDLVISTINDFPLVLRNNSEKINRNHYLKIRLKGTGMNTGGIGARLDATCGNNTYTQEFMPSRGFMSSVNHEIIFGLGGAAVVDTLRIRWPDMREQVLTSVKAGQCIVLNNDDALITAPRKKPPAEPVFVRVENNKVLDFRHVENEYNDFRDQVLLPHFLSTQGPHIAKGDVNNDGLEDLFFGGARGCPGRLYLQSGDGSFRHAPQACFVKDMECEDVGAVFFDADGDNDLDLYVVSGGNEFPGDAAELQDRLYLNNGKGSYSAAKGRLPVMITSGSCVKSCDIDGDGDADLFVGGRLIPSQYPFAPRSYILENDGKGFFTDVTASYNAELLYPGMVTDAVWTDFNLDGKPDLIIVGEWMKIRFFRNAGGKKLEEITGICGPQNTEGWWNTIVAADFDNDGDDDYIAGNLGLNSRIKVSPAEPCTIYAGDFDNNGTIDAIMSYFIQGRSYPFYSKDDLQKQMPFIKQKYPTYESYASLTITDIFSEDALSRAEIFEAKTFSSCYIENRGNDRFEIKPLPREAQYFPVYGICPGDFDNDGNTDIVLAGNFFGSRIKFSDYDAGKGLLLRGDGKGNFTPLDDLRSGLFIRGEARDVAGIRTPGGSGLIVFALNNDSLRLYKHTVK